MLISTQSVDPRLEKAMHEAFGDPVTNGYDPPVSQYRPRLHTPRRRACCPHCNTRADHFVEKVLAKGSLLECVWCWDLFSTIGNCR